MADANHRAEQLIEKLLPQALRPEDLQRLLESIMDLDDVAAGSGGVGTAGTSAAAGLAAQTMALGRAPGWVCTDSG